MKQGNIIVLPLLLSFSTDDFNMEKKTGISAKDLLENKFRMSDMMKTF